MSDLLSAPKSEWRLGQNGKLARAPLYHQLYTALRDAILDGPMHVGIHSPLAEDAIIDGKTAATGGVTAAIACFRTGGYYLNNGDIRVGHDADCIMRDPDEPFTVRAAEGCTPFESMELTGRVKSTGLRGAPAFDDGDIAGVAIGKYLSRPSARPR